MKLTKNQEYFIKRNEVMIQGILEKRIEDLKETLLEVPEEKRSATIAFIKEYKAGLGLLKEMNKTKQPEDKTGV